MKIRLSENLRSFRLRKGMTQEQLAAAMGVSAQAVSRWENGSSCPDITMLPDIANLFGTSLDELVGAEHGPIEPDSVFREESHLRAEGRLQEAISVLREALRIYPNNHGFQSELALTLTLLGGDNSIREAIRLSERVLSESTSAKLRSTTAANLCFLYLKVNDTSKADALVRTLPHLWESRELLLPELAASGYNAALHDAIGKTLDVLCHKIRTAPAHRHAVPDSVISSGVPFHPDVPFREKLQIIDEFLAQEKQD